MAATLLRRALSPKPHLILSPLLSLYPYATTPPPHPRLKSPTPSETQFETWTQSLAPGFTPSDLIHALRSQPDPDLAYDLFRWASLRRGFRHTPATYLAILQISAASRRHSLSLSLLDEVLSGACPPSLPLFNSLLRFSTSRRTLFTKSFDIYKKMLSLSSCKPDLDTYTMLLAAVLRRLNRPPASFVYLKTVRTLFTHMKSFGVIPDAYALNMVIKAYCRCLYLDEAVRVYREMGLYGCDPNAYTYSYLIKGMCEKGRVGAGLGLYREMREKGMVPRSSAFMALACGLAMERRFEEAARVVRDMLANGVAPDAMTYRTLVEEMCRDGRGGEAVGLVEEFRKGDAAMGERTYRMLLDAVRFVDRDR